MINYLSLWIANLGVDPLFSIMFFLALPAFFLLNLLLHLVCIVFEAMILPLPFYINYLCKFRPLFLSGQVLNVKAFLLFASIMLQPNISQASNIKEIFISPGEQIELKNIKLDRYSVGNKDVLHHKYRKRNNQILVKGKKIGFSDLMIWHGKQKQTYHFYVISKKEQLKKISLIESLKKFNLNIRTQGEIVYANGMIESETNYLLLKNIQMQKHKNLVLDLKLSPKLHNEILTKIYNDLYSYGAQKVLCNSIALNIHCAIHGLELNSPIVKHYRETFFIQTSNQFLNYLNRNYMAYFKIIQIETNKNDIQKLGLAKISAKIQQLLNFNQIINQEKIHLGEIEGSINVLAQPKTALIIDQKAHIQLGGELPYTITSNNNSELQWKFYGLKISTLLKTPQGKPLINFTTELTTPNNRAITGSKGSSSIFVDHDKYIKLFEVGYEVNTDHKESLPILGDIPLLNSLFSSEERSQAYKHIICYLKLEEIK